MDVDEPCSLRNVGKRIVVIIRMLLQRVKHRPLQPIPLVQLIEGNQYIFSLFHNAQIWLPENQRHYFFLALFLGLVIVNMLAQDHAHHLSPVLVQNFFSQLVGPHAVGAESLHSEVIYETILDHSVYVLRNLRIG